MNRAQTDKLRLYYSPGSCSLAPHVILHELEAPHEARRVFIPAGENTTPEYLEINKWGRVPVLEIDGQRLTEAPAILSFLADLDPSRGLLPETGTIDRGHAMKWLCWLSSSVHIAYAQLWRPRRFLSEEGPADADLAAVGRSAIETFYSHIESEHDGRFMIADRFTVVDAFLLPFYRWGGRIGMDMSRYPRWSRAAAAHVDRPAVARALEVEGFTRDGVLNPA